MVHKNRKLKAEKVTEKMIGKTINPQPTQQGQVPHGSPLGPIKWSRKGDQARTRTENRRRGNILQYLAKQGQGPHEGPK